MAHQFNTTVICWHQTWKGDNKFTRLTECFVLLSWPKGWGGSGGLVLEESLQERLGAKCCYTLGSSIKFMLFVFLKLLHYAVNARQKPFKNPSFLYRALWNICRNVLWKVMALQSSRVNLKWSKCHFLFGCTRLKFYFIYYFDVEI